MTEVQTNLRVLKPSRKKLHAGDVFTMQLPDEDFLFGRVVSTEAKWALAASANAILIYVYRHRSRVAEVPVGSAMRPSELLVPPIMINRLPWSRGYFQTLSRVPLESEDVLPQHCFHSASRGRYYDEHGNELWGPTQPVGDHGLHSFRTVDDLISDALGIPRVSED